MYICDNIIIYIYMIYIVYIYICVYDIYIYPKSQRSLSALSTSQNIWQDGRHCAGGGGGGATKDFWRGGKIHNSIAMENGPFIDGLPIKNGDFNRKIIIFNRKITGIVVSKGNHPQAQLFRLVNLITV